VVYQLKDSHPSSTNRAQRRVTVTNDASLPNIGYVSCVLKMKMVVSRWVNNGSAVHSINHTVYGLVV